MGPGARFRQRTARYSGTGSQENLATSGVSNPVTAVLLNFRAYDTLLELAVLLTAVLGIFALGPARPGYRSAGPVFDSLAHWLVPVLILTAGYLLWVGAHAPGGAFQAGAILAAAGVVLRLRASALSVYHRNAHCISSLPRVWACSC